MAKDDKLIEDFFQEMKEADRKVPIPTPPAYPGRRNWLPYAAAASVLAVVTTYVMVREPNHEQTPLIEVSLSPASNTTTESLLVPAQGIDTWKSPTQSLINDF